jgi:hypothetical protein
MPGIMANSDIVSVGGEEKIYIGGKKAFMSRV